MQKQRNILLITFLLMLTTSPLVLTAQWYENKNEALTRADQKQVPVLLVFSGSDWCRPCIRFKNEVLNDTDFLQFAGDRLVLLNADFPQRKQQAEELIRQNEQLAEQFNPQGFFPHIVLLNPDGSHRNDIPYTKQNTAEFIKQLKVLLPEMQLKEYKKRVPSMGSFFEFTVVDSPWNEQQAWQAIALCIEEVNRVEQLISEWISTSEVSRINRNAGIKPVEVSDEVFQLIERSIHIGKLTQGAFDITFHALDGLWRFDGTQTRPPDSSAIQKALGKVGYQKIELSEPNAVYLPVKGMSIGFGGIGQGYAVDRIKTILEKRGVHNFVINSSGDIYASGRRADGTSWKVGVANPFNKKEIIRWLDADDRAVVTSGNYEKYFEYNGQRFAHIINPKTGWPAGGIVSTTVISPFTEMADALATAIFVLGTDVSLNLINQLPDIHCIIIDDKKTVHYSRDLIIDK